MTTPRIIDVLPGETDDQAIERFNSNLLAAAFSIELPAVPPVEPTAAQFNSNLLTAAFPEATVTAPQAPAQVDEPLRVAKGRCHACGKAIPPTGMRGRPSYFCSAACKDSARPHKARAKAKAVEPKPEHTCKNCGVVIKPTGKRGRPAFFCSDACKKLGKI